MPGGTGNALDSPGRHELIEKNRFFQPTSYMYEPRGYVYEVGVFARRHEYDPGQTKRAGVHYYAYSQQREQKAYLWGVFGH